MKINIIIGFTPYHAYVMDSILPRITGDCYCYFSKNWPKDSLRYKKIGFSCKNVFFRKLSNVISLLYLSLFFHFFARGKQIELYIPHPLNVASNYLFFSGKIFAIHIYEDGLLNYYDATAEYKTINSKLKVFGKLIGLPFRDFCGHLSGCFEKPIDTLWVSNPKQVVNKNRFNEIISLNIVKNGFPISKGIILFLDQDTSPFLSNYERDNLISSMFLRYPPEGNRYLYKRHHDFHSSIPFMTEVDEYLICQPAEEVIDIIRPEIVISFYSSALFNISSLYPSVRCIAIASSYINFTRNGMSCCLSDFFQEVGVEVGLK